MLELIIAILSMLYIWWIYFLLVSAKKERYNPNYRVIVSVIIPCYNENYSNLKKCIDSIIRADGDKQIILVDNNSNKKETIQAVNEYLNNPKVLVLNESKQGKRFAHGIGLKYAQNEIIVFVDSDTILDKMALKELIIPFQDPRVGGVTGQVKLANESTNIITKCLDSLFWSSFNIFRCSSGLIGFMQVMPGALSSYRKSDLIKLENGYLTQTFLGRPCSISDDRYLTIRIQTRLCKQIKYMPKAIAYTFMPSTLIGFWKVLERWKRGMIREVILQWKEPISNAKLLFFDTQFNFIVFNIVMVFRIALIFSLIFFFSVKGLLAAVLWILIMNFYRFPYVLIYNPRIFPYKMLYSLINEFFWVFSYIHALINIRNQGKWSTR